jgi:hypothetical protein
VTHYINERKDLMDKRDTKNLDKVNRFCINHLKKSKYYREIAIEILNNYTLVYQDVLFIQENAFVVYGHLPNVKKYLEISNLKLRTCEDILKDKKKFH